MNNQIKKIIEIFKRGNHKLALEICIAAITQNPNNTELKKICGNMFGYIGEYKNARQQFLNIIKLNSDDIDALFNIGFCYKQEEKFSLAIEYYQLYLGKVPNHIDGWLNLSECYLKIKNFYLAENCAKKSLIINPSQPEAWFYLANARKFLGKFHESIGDFTKAISLKPNYVDALNDKGVLLLELKNYEEALVTFENANNINPQIEKIFSNKGIALFNLKRYADALESFDKAIRINIDYIQAWINKGLCLTKLKLYDEAYISFDTAIKINPDHDYLLGHWIHSKMLIGNWGGIDNDIKLLTNKINEKKSATEPFAFLSLVDSLSLLLSLTKNWVDEKFPNITQLPPVAKKTHPKIRLGYFSADYTNHPISHLMSELFKIHNRDKFEVFAFSLKGTVPGDQMRNKLLKSFDQFYNLENISDKEIAIFSRTLEVDIAIDLSGHTESSRPGIFAYRAAPIQINYLGYPGTQGANYFDYIIADKIVIPLSSVDKYIEKIIYLPHTFMVNDSKRIPSIRQFTKKECSLPEGKFIFCCFNKSYKFNKEILISWAKIMLSVENSILWLSSNNTTFANNILKEFSKLEISSDRIFFADHLESMSEYLARYRLADLFLDTFPYNAHTTAVDSLKSGLPLLCKIGESFASRVSASLLNVLGLPELITYSSNEYENLAIALANNPQKIKVIKDKLESNLSTSPLFDTRLFARYIELGYQTSYDRYHAGLQQENIDLSL